MCHILKSISDFTLDPYALIWCTGKWEWQNALLLLGICLELNAFDVHWRAVLVSPEYFSCGARVEHTWAVPQVPTFPMDPSPPGSFLHMHAIHLLKTADKKLHCNKHNGDICSRRVMDFVKFNTPPSLLLFHQDTAFLLRLGLSGRRCSHSHGTETTTNIPNCVHSEFIWRPDPNMINILEKKHLKTPYWLGWVFPLEVWTLT